MLINAGRVAAASLDRALPLPSAAHRLCSPPLRIVAARCDTNPLQIIAVLFLGVSIRHISFAVLDHALLHHANASHFHAVATLFDSVPQPGVTLRILALPRLSYDMHFLSAAVQAALCPCTTSACHSVPVRCHSNLFVAVALHHDSFRCRYGAPQCSAMPCRCWSMRS